MDSVFAELFQPSSPVGLGSTEKAKKAMEAANAATKEASKAKDEGR